MREIVFTSVVVFVSFLAGSITSLALPMFQPKQEPKVTEFRLEDGTRCAAWHKGGITCQWHKIEYVEN